MDIGVVGSSDVVLRILTVHNASPNDTVANDDKNKRYNVANEDVHYNVVNLFVESIVPGFKAMWK